MKKLVLTSLGAAMLALIGCDDGSSDLLGGAHAQPWSKGSLAAGVTNTWDHMAQLVGGDNGITDPQVKQLDDQSIGPPDVVARLHGAQKLQYASLGLLLADLGVKVTNTTA